MSLASCSYQTTYVPDGTSVTATLLCPTGDLEQVYNGIATPGGFIMISTDLDNAPASDYPVLAVSVMESDPNITTANIQSCIIDADTDYYVNGKKLVFNSNGLSVEGSAIDEATGYGECFRKLLSDPTATGRYRADAPYGGLEVCKNLVVPSGGVNINVKVALAMQISGKSSKFGGGTYIKMRQSTGESSWAQIYCASGQSFVLNETNDSVTCQVRCYRAGSQVTPASYKWYMFKDGVFGVPDTPNTSNPPAANATTATYTVDRSMVPTFTDVKVECYDGSGNLIASDIQTIQDASDALFISPNPSPADGTFYQTGGPTQIVFTPKLLHTDGTQQSGAQFRFTVVDSAGNVQNDIAGNGMALNTATSTSFTLPKSVIGLINEAPSVLIEAIG